MQKRALTARAEAAPALQAQGMQTVQVRDDSEAFVPLLEDLRRLRHFKELEQQLRAEYVEQ